MHIKPTTITYKIAFAGIISATTILCAVILMLSGVAFFSLKHAYIQEAQTEAFILADNISKTMHRNGDLDEASLDTAASVDSMITNIVVRKNEGEIIYFYTKDNQTASSLDHIFKTSPNDFSLTVNKFFINVPLVVNGEIKGSLYLIKSVDELQKSVLVYAIFSIIILAVSVFVSWLIMARVKRVLPPQKIVYIKWHILIQ